jgi:hypothetical protein
MLPHPYHHITFGIHTQQRHGNKKREYELVIKLPRIGILFISLPTISILSYDGLRRDWEADCTMLQRHAADLVVKDAQAPISSFEIGSSLTTNPPKD